MIACINFIYAELFVKKWQEYQDSLSAGDELTKSFSELKNQLLEADNKCSAVQESKIIVEQNLLKHQQLVSELESQILINEQKIKVNQQDNQTLQSELNTLKSKLSRKREKSTAINNG
jgi:septal ring factor EnvC (AmiA/AmiB activator)